MTMRSVCFAATLAAVGLLAWGSRAPASDTVPLVLVKPAGQSADDDDDNHLAHFRFRVRYRYRPFVYSYGFRYRPFVYSYSYRPYYAYSYRPYYAYSYSVPYYSSFYYPTYYRGFSFSLGVGPSCYYYYPISMTLSSGGVVSPDCLPGTPTTPATPATPDATPKPAPPMPKTDDGTFPYDGGPMTPAPMPRAEPKPSVEVPPSGRLVSHTIEPSPKSKWVYPAYGEKPRRSSK
jgi:hypothetical protein